MHGRDIWRGRNRTAAGRERIKSNLRFQASRRSRTLRSIRPEFPSRLRSAPRFLSANSRHD